MDHLRQPKKTILDTLKGNTPLYFLLGYLGVIFLGMLLLMLPISAQDGQITGMPDALFTATSAVCVTGLSPVVTAEHWTLFGQIVIILLIQIGGLGIMTFVAIFGLLTNQRFSIADRKRFMEEKNQNELTGMVRLIKFIILATFVLEGVGAFFLALRFVPQFGVIKGLWFSVFHAISAFCNAGFDLLGPESLTAYQHDPLVLLTIATLIILAGIGYTVYLDLWRMRKGDRLHLHSKIVLSSTAILLLGGTVLIFLMEANNPQTMGALSLPEKGLNAFFQSVTTRTAGFCTFAQDKMTQASGLGSIFLMFIGGSPAGTAGGLKTTTMVALLLGLASALRSSRDVSVFRRTIAQEVVHNAFVLFALATIWNILVLFFLSITEKAIPLGGLLFETISAFGTVGLTQNVTPQLSVTGKMLIALTMLYGKLGPLTLLHALIPKARVQNNRLAEEHLLVG